MSQIYNIPAGFSFLKELANSLIHRALPEFQVFEDRELDNLSNVLVLLPTQRACRDFQDILFEANGHQPLILPEIRAFGGMDEEWVILGESEYQNGESLDLPMAISPMERKLILSKLIMEMSKAGGLDGRLNLDNPAMAMHMASDLAKLLDSVVIEEADPTKFDNLVSEDFAENWQQILTFLNIIFKNWPHILDEQGKIDAVNRRQLLMQLEIEHFKSMQNGSHKKLIIAAGSTASVMATKKFLRDLLKVDHSAVILPGLDQQMDEQSWENVGLAHPQNNLKNFLNFAEIDRSSVQLLPSLIKADDEAKNMRRLLASEVVRPSETSHQWHLLEENFDENEISAAIREKVDLVEAPNLQIEAQAIALMMKKAVHEDQKAALITPDRQLARRVQNELKRFDIHVDDSSGVPLSSSLHYGFMKLLLDLMEKQFNGHQLLAILKHPLLGREWLPNDVNLARAALCIELVGLRGASSYKTLNELADQIDRKFRAIHIDQDVKYLHPSIKLLRQEDFEHATLVLRQLSKLMSELFSLSEADYLVFLQKHIELVEDLSGKDDAQHAFIWQGDYGEALANMLSDMLAQEHFFEAMHLSEYSDLLDSLISGQMVRSKKPSHPNLQILGAMEARLADLDIAILGGLNEGVWPQIPQNDAWISRNMMAEIGLPAPERRVGLSAHDFIAAFCVDKIYITRSEKLGGAPTIASRWLLRLNAVLSAMHIKDAIKPDLDWVLMAELMNKPDQVSPSKKPEPKPDVALRPKQMSVTEIETWIRDPYAIYAKRILNLRPLDEVGKDIGASEKGSLIHDILDQFTKDYKGKIIDGALDKLLELGTKEYAEIKREWPELYAFWWPRFEKVAAWFIENEKYRRLKDVSHFTEVNGKMAIAASYGESGGEDFILTARADRIDVYQQDALIIDYKTGMPPTAKQIEAGFSPQLSLEAAILSFDGFFEGSEQIKIEQSLPIQFSYLQLSGGNPAGKQIDFAKMDYQSVIDQTLEGLKTRIADFAMKETAYKPRELADFAAKFRDYDHLSRMKEWSIIDGEEA